MTTMTQTTVALTLADNDVAAPQREMYFEHGDHKAVGREVAAASLIGDLWTIPSFDNKIEERQWAKEHMAGAFRFLAKKGYTDGAGGHISLRDPVKTDCFWISTLADLQYCGCLTARCTNDITTTDPYAVHFGLLKASDLILVDEEGNAVSQTEHKVNRAGFMIHAALHKARPDVHAAVHSHSPYGRAWSVFGRGIEMLNQGKLVYSSTV